MRAGPVICLLGMPGSGKTTVGPLLADRLGSRFVDLDALVVATAGRDVTQIFEAEGEAGFRRRELAELAELVSDSEPVVVATGGGVVTNSDARDLLAGVTCVWLDATLDTLLERLRNESASRPLLALDPEGALRRLHDERSEYYREVADHVVLTDDREPGDVAVLLADLVLGVSG